MAKASYVYNHPFSVRITANASIFRADPYICIWAPKYRDDVLSLSLRSPGLVLPPGTSDHFYPFTFKMMVLSVTSSPSTVISLQVWCKCNDCRVKVVTISGK